MIVRMDHASIVVEDLDAATAFFVELGMEREGGATVGGEWVDRINGIDGVKAEIVMVRTPDGNSKLELTKFLTPAAINAGTDAPSNTLGLRSIMFAVDDIDDDVARLRAHGGELVGEIAEYGGYRLGYVRGPAGVIVALAQQLG